MEDFALAATGPKHRNTRFLMDGLEPDIKELIRSSRELSCGEVSHKNRHGLYIAVKPGILFSPMHGWTDQPSNQERGYVKPCPYVVSIQPSRVALLHTVYAILSIPAIAILRGEIVVPEGIAFI